ncbi:MAG TPA: hypothetical protein VFI53_01185, partial [Myxococcaceae bacterium]|nr:hypothetical protein [Myxococcaceae bacterium]
MSSTDKALTPEVAPISTSVDEASTTSAGMPPDGPFQRLSASWIRPEEALWPRWIWLRALGLIFLSVFYSLAFQITGLLGPRGILPAGAYLVQLHQAVGMPKALWYAPTLFWI